LLGVSVAQISLLINTQIASHLGAGSVSWLSYADRLMEFPIAMLGVALGVVLTPQLAAAKASADAHEYGAMIDWGLRLVVLLSVPCAVALLTFAEPLVATLFHYGAFSAKDVAKTAPALMGYGCGVVGLIAIKVLAPAYYAKQDTKTPMLIAVSVLIITQLLNWMLVPWLNTRGLGHAGLALSIGLAAWINAALLLAGLIRRGAYRPLRGWGRFVLQVVTASALMAIFLLWAANGLDWIGLRSQPYQRLGWLGMVIVGAAAVYFTACVLSGVQLRRMLKPSVQHEGRASSGEMRD